jgi:hydrogenase nickel incorporation protein HypA/HybF
MHEIGLMQNILRTALDLAMQKNAKKINHLKIRVGELQGIVPDSLHYIFGIISQGTIAQGAKLEVEPVSMTCLCLQCRLEFQPKNFQQECPHCHQSNIEIRHGREFELIDIKIS